MGYGAKDFPGFAEKYLREVDEVRHNLCPRCRYREGCGNASWMRQRMYFEIDDLAETSRRSAIQPKQDDARGISRIRPSSEI